jgi:hypothetical protein
MEQKVFITKYALTTGIMECEMDVYDDGKGCYGKPDGFAFKTGFYGNDFHLTKEDAIKDCNKRKEKKIESLKKQMTKIEKLTF